MSAGRGGGREAPTTAVRVLVAVLLVVVAAAGCAGTAGPAGPPLEPAGPAVMYVAVGASDAVGLGADRPLSQAWPQVLYRTAMTRATTFVNLAAEGSTVADALAQQVPSARDLEPSLVTVSLGVNDLRAEVDPADYEEQLGSLVRRLRRGGAARVLVANTPPIDHLPAYVAEAGGSFPASDDLLALVTAYNQAVARVAAVEGAELVDLHAAGMAARAEGAEASLVAADGFHPSTAGHARIAAAFAAVL
ncbi:MAG: hypothetical protein GEV08_12550 [Acidimicrobiia bacterium]|nr:hypothetical protein [Acidimicrobiia bacterium]